MSVYYDILQGVKRRVEDAVGGFCSVVVRRRPEFRASDALPICIVSPDSNGEKSEVETFNQGIVWSYPVLVVLFTKANRELSLGPNDMTLRESIRDELYQMQPLVGQTAVYDLDIELSGPFNLRDPQQTTETDAFRVIYFSNESRKA